MTEALYRQVYRTLSARIREGAWAVGDRLPAQEELTTEFSVSAITISRALDMLREDGYVSRRPRIGTVVLAQDPERQSTGLAKVGYVVPGFDDAFGTAVLGGLLDTAADRAHVVLGVTEGDVDREQRLIDQHLQLGIDALVLQPTSSQWIPPGVVALVAKSFPIVIVDRSLAGVPVSTVASDNVTGGRLAADHLFDLGHRRLCMVMSANEVSTLADRQRGFLAAHAHQPGSVDADHVFTGVRSVVPGAQVGAEQDVAALSDLLRRQPEVTGYVASEYHIGLLLLRAAAQVGLDVPEDISVVCFDSPLYPEGDNPLTHVRQDQNRLGQWALDQALTQISEPGSIAQEVLDVHLIAGRSSGPAPVGGPAGRPELP